MKKYLFVPVFSALLLMGLLPCQIYRVTGVPCPTCGMTRAYKALLCGDIRNAFLMHPLFWLPPVFLVPRFRTRRWIFVAACVFLAVYIIRMICMFPDVPPMNYNYNSLIGEFLR
ncbi:MAG: DUF2752 domain-containing protein [Firmicutes bacterium]|nr:DUF2752 domain-containing protein [Bacillota bacterium]